MSGALATSVTYDESFHVPAGVAYVSSGNTGVSPVNPPLGKALFGLAALAGGARAPAQAVLSSRDARTVNEAFMRDNRDRYRAIYTAARLVDVLLSALLGWLVWSVARARFGACGALLSLATWTLAPEALAHAGLATLDIQTALLWLASFVAAGRAVRTGSWRDVSLLVAAGAAFALTRFTALLVLPLTAALWAVAKARGEAAPLTRALRVAVVPVAMLVALWIGHGGRVFSKPLEEWRFASERFRSLKAAHPSWRLPLPDDVVAGLDHQSADAEPGHLSTYVLGRSETRSVWWYFPFAIVLKWPLGLLVAVLVAMLRLILARRWSELDLALAAAIFLLPAMTFGNLGAGVRYVLPLLPLACVSVASLWPSGGSSLARAAALVPVLAVALESASAAPWWLSHFNPLAGSPERRERMLNDSNVDWGQGLVALKRELDSRKIGTVHLAYLGTTDPALYGIAFEPYWTGAPGPESDWLAVSSYFYVGLPQTVRMKDGPSPFIVNMDFSKLPAARAAARPGDCIWLFKLR